MWPNANVTSWMLFLDEYEMHASTSLYLDRRRVEIIVWALTVYEWATAVLWNKCDEKAVSLCCGCFSQPTMKANTIYLDTYIAHVPYSAYLTLLGLEVYALPCNRSYNRPNARYGRATPSVCEGFPFRCSILHPKSFTFKQNAGVTPRQSHKLL